MIKTTNLTRFALDEKSFSQVAKKVLSGENKGGYTVSLAFVDKAEMKKINNKFRKKNKPTDVLSFELVEGKTLGEVIICPDVVKENAKKYGVTYQFELIKVFIHGILHILGYDHELSEKEEVRMFKKQDYYLSKIKWPKAI